MPVPTLVNYQWQVRSLLQGALTIYQPDVPGIKGLAEPIPKSYDVDLEGSAGSYAANDQSAARVVTIPMSISCPGSTAAADAMNALSALSTAWAASTSDIPLYIKLPGWGRFYLTGRPRGLAEDLTSLTSGIIRVQATFFCPNPAITAAP